jgi:hypothetical protein
MNPYTTLEVSMNSSMEEIKKSFRTKAKMYHPDVCSGDDCSKKFKIILQAYELLKKNNWVWNDESIKDINLDEIYRDFIRKNPVYLYYFTEKVNKSQSRWDSLRNRS